jgi:pSer/pThr/pTyr-binding forkhead associated (FHA) protein
MTQDEDRGEVEAEERRLEEAALAREEQKATARLDQDETLSVPGLFSRAFGLRQGAAEEYMLVPPGISEDEIKTVPLWRIEFHNLAGSSLTPPGFDVVGDAIMGRAADASFTPDISFSAYNAVDKGVSRRHAMLRPSPNRLYLIDLGSTNGTLHNAVPIGKGLARALHDGDTVSLGQLTFTLKVIDSPPMRMEGPAPSDAAPEMIRPGDTSPLSEDPFDAHLGKEDTIILPAEGETKKLGDQKKGENR